MTERLFWADPYLRDFEATVLDVRPAGERCEVVLDRTAFYPTSGGQMHDTGLLGGAPVEDVVEKDGIVVHLVRGRVRNGARVRCLVDWQRRFDFMQQHTAFHLLAQAFLRVSGAQTLSSHLGEEVSTLELDTDEVSADALAEAEGLANTVAWEDRVVRTFVVQPEKVPKLVLRKAPKVEGPVRLVEIEDVDLDPCSGTHVATTGQVGLIKLLSSEKLRGHLRFRFVAGMRALRDYRFRAETLDQLATELTTGPRELLAVVKKLRSQYQSALKQLRATQERLLEAIRAQVLAEQPLARFRVLDELNGIDWALVRKLAFQLLDGGVETVVVLQSAPEIHLAVGTRRRGLDLRELVPELCAALGAKGGGRPDFVEMAGGYPDRLATMMVLLRGRLDGRFDSGEESAPL